MSELTQERLKELLHYDPETGVFTWVREDSRKRAEKNGHQAGCVCKRDGYRIINIDGRPRPAHRLAWLYVFGAWPTNEIDHINGVRNDNRMVNLRDVSKSVNMQNILRARKDSKIGLRGVGHHKSSGLYSSTIFVDGKRRSLGYFKNPEEAHQAYLAAKRKLHPGFAF